MKGADKNAPSNIFCDPAIPFIKIQPTEMDIYCAPKDMDKDVHPTVIHNKKMRSRYHQNTGIFTLGNTIE